jgi:hypothetical protein
LRRQRDEVGKVFQALFRILLRDFNFCVVSCVPGLFGAVPRGTRPSTLLSLEFEARANGEPAFVDPKRACGDETVPR